jgi:hypothetical protein
MKSPNADRADLNVSRLPDYQIALVNEILARR